MVGCVHGVFGNAITPAHPTSRVTNIRKKSVDDEYEQSQQWTIRHAERFPGSEFRRSYARCEREATDDPCDTDNAVVVQTAAFPPRDDLERRVGPRGAGESGVGGK